MSELSCIVAMLMVTIIVTLFIVIYGKPIRLRFKWDNGGGSKAELDAEYGQEDKKNSTSAHNTGAVLPGNKAKDS